MTDHEALLAAIRAAPDADRPRLVYADWLEDHGQAERAEFVRVQCELARTPIIDEGPRRALRHRLHELRGHTFPEFPGEWVVSPNGDRNWHGWIVTLLGAGDYSHPTAYFARGLADVLRCPAAAWLAHGDAIVSLHPLRTVRLTNRPDYGSGANGLGLRGDPMRKRWPAREVVEAQFNGRAPLIGNDVTTLLALRWPGVAFELPGAWYEFTATDISLFTNEDAVRQYGIR